MQYSLIILQPDKLSLVARFLLRASLVKNRVLWCLLEWLLPPSPLFFFLLIKTKGGSPRGSVVKNLPAMPETWVQSLGQKGLPGEGNGNPLQCSCLEIPVDRGARQATVHGVTKSYDTERLTTIMKSSRFGISLVVLWLRLHVPSAGAQV